MGRTSPRIWRLVRIRNDFLGPLAEFNRYILMTQGKETGYLSTILLSEEDGAEN